VGSALVRYLTARKHEVVPLVRSRSKAGIYWNPESGEIELDKLNGFDAVVHLAGENIASGRWTPARKARLLSSRVKGTSLLSESIAKLLPPPQVLVSASAIGYYGDRGAEPLREDSAPGRGFLADCCRQWEAATEAAVQKRIRVVNLRIGVVLARHGGALGKMLLPFRLGLGGKVGSGDQYMSWISLEDLCSAILCAIQTDTLRGPVNAVAPEPVTNLEFTKTLGQVLSRPTIFPLPAFAARLAFGEMADELLLSGQKVEPAKLLGSGFEFKYRTLESTLREILGNRR